ncbi:hypothetical protein [Prosthecobacter dejongeii]|uniref:Uncharacterized protein n=1 Tax=Prosthecobacter dejongeii TaxID=48465 RepID=A0A7W8DN53_9BACT|nr:hypothetical protein [Prosthecobacter dejongeii]MBB5036184.1 hypothetical protein [Prosthecobacter dejongeii]
MNFESWTSWSFNSAFTFQYLLGALSLYERSEMPQMTMDELPSRRMGFSGARDVTVCTRATAG